MGVLEAQEKSSEKVYDWRWSYALQKKEAANMTQQGGSRTPFFSLPQMSYQLPLPSPNPTKQPGGKGISLRRYLQAGFLGSEKNKERVWRIKEAETQ